MALSTYNELQASIADWLNRQDLAPVIPDFIRLLEGQVERTLRVREMLTRTELPLSPGTSGLITLPDDYLALQELRLSRNSDGQVVPIAYASKHELSEILARTAGAVGIPQAFTVTGAVIEVAPWPDTDYTATLFYYRKISRLSASVSSNWLLENHPDVYLYGSLMQAAPYLKHDERVPLWSSALNTLLEEMRIADERASKAGVPLKMRIKPYG